MINPNFPSYQDESSAKALERVKQATSDVEKVQIINGAIDSAIDGIAKSFADTLKDGVEVNNLDEVKLHLRTELTRSLRPLMDGLREMQDSSDFIVLRRPNLAADVTVKNISDIKIPKETKVKNLSDLEKYFETVVSAVDGLKTALNGTMTRMPVDFATRIPTPKAPIVNVPPLNLDRLLSALEPLEYLSDDPKKPIAVRLSDGEKFMKKILQQVSDSNKYLQAVSNSSGGATSDELRVLGVSVPRSGSQKVVTVTAAGTPHNLSSGTTSSGTSVATKAVYLSGSTDSGVIMVVGFTNAVRATSGNKNGIVIIPGNDPIAVETSDLNNLWVDAETSGGKLCVAYSIP